MSRRYVNVVLAKKDAYCDSLEIEIYSFVTAA
jgi:hypothetical protein